MENLGFKEGGEENDDSEEDLSDDADGAADRQTASGEKKDEP